MQSAMDFALIEALPILLRRQQFYVAATRHHQRLRNGSKFPVGVNVAELFLITTRVRVREALWLAASTAEVEQPFGLSDLLKLRHEFRESLWRLSGSEGTGKVAPFSKAFVLATYLAITPCPTVSGLCRFAKIQPNRARVWLRRLVKGSILLFHPRSNELVFLNVLLVSRLTHVSPWVLRKQFDATVSKPNWITCSIFRTVS